MTAIDVTDNSFQHLVLEADHPVLVYFTAEWCAPCKFVTPRIDRLATEYAGRMVIAKYDYGNNRDWASKYGVQSVPSILLFNAGALHKRISGHDLLGTLRVECEQLIPDANLPAEAGAEYERAVKAAKTRFNRRKAALHREHMKIPQMRALQEACQPVDDEFARRYAPYKAKEESGEITTREALLKNIEIRKEIEADPQFAHLVAQEKAALEDLHKGSGKQRVADHNAKVAIVEREYDEAIASAVATRNAHSKPGTL